MPDLVRMTKYNRWLDTNPSWLADGEIPADPLYALHVQSENVMSVWEVDENVRDFKGIVAGLAATRKVQDFDFVLLNANDVADIGIVIKETPGDSPDMELNQLHRDLKEISAEKAIRLTRLILQQIALQKTRGGEKRVDRVLRKKVAEHIWNGIEKGQINRDSIDPKVLEGVRKELDKKPRQV